MAGLWGGRRDAGGRGGAPGGGPGGPRWWGLRPRPPAQCEARPSLGVAGLLESAGLGWALPRGAKPAAAPAAAGAALEASGEVTGPGRSRAEAPAAGAGPGLLMRPKTPAASPPLPPVRGGGDEKSSGGRPGGSAAEQRNAPERDAISGLSPLGGSAGLLDGGSPGDAAAPPTGGAVIYEQFSREWSNIYHQDSFDGFRLEALKPVTPAMQAAHTFLLGTSSRENQVLYQFGPTYASEDGSLLAMSRLGTDGVANLRVVSKTPRAECKVSASSALDQPQRNMLELSYDRTARDWTAGFKLAWQGAWLYNASLAQMIGSKLTVGGDVTYIQTNGGSIGTLGARYTPSPDHVLTASVTRQPNFKTAAGFFQNLHALKLQYFRRVSPRLSLGCEYELQQESPGYETALRCGYEYMFRQAKLQGMADSTGKIAMNAQDASGFGLSATADFQRSDYRVGFMVSLYPQPSPAPGEAAAAGAAAPAVL